MNTFSGEFTGDGASPTGTLNGVEDSSGSSGPSSGGAFSANYSMASSPTNGRGTFNFNGGSGGSGIGYMISLSKFVMIPLSDPDPAVWVFEQR